MPQPPLCPAHAKAADPPRASLTHGDVPGRQPRRHSAPGQVTLRVTFGTPANYRTENIAFDVADIPLPYNGILGRPTLAKFMAASQYAYNVLKIPDEWGIINIKADQKDAIYCVEQMSKAAAAAFREEDCEFR